MYKKFFKRPLDLLAGTILFVILLPFLLIIGMILFLCTGHLLFLQERVGYRGRTFRVVKFCTMTNAKDSDGNLLPDEERVTKFGTFLRNYSLDELPQLINIIKGDMSLVGPRPFMERYEADCTEQQLRRHEVRPGVTGLAQIRGRNAVSYEHRFMYDVWYVDHCTFQVDFRILWATGLMILGVSGKNNMVDYNPAIEARYRTGEGE